MKKSELKKYLLILRKNLNLDKNDTNLYKVYMYGRFKLIYLPEWFFEMKRLLTLLKESIGNNIVKLIIVKYYFENKNDVKIINELPISEATYYKYKRYIEDMLYQLFIYESYVTLNEILEEEVN